MFDLHTCRRCLQAIALACAAMGIVSCSPSDPKSKLADYNKRIGPQASYDGQHLYVNWPALGALGPTSLRVPRAYLDEPPFRKAADGQVAWVYVRFVLTKTGQIESVTTQSNDVLRAEGSRLVNVTVRQSGGGGARLRDAYRRGTVNERMHRDGDIGGLERYSQYACFDEQKGEAPNDFILGKMPDDPAPKNCRTNRFESIIVSPQSVTDDRSGAAIRCLSTVCVAYFDAAGRGGEMRLEHGELDKWDSLIEPARRLIDEFMMGDGAQMDALLSPNLGGELRGKK